MKTFDRASCPKTNEGRCLFTARVVDCDGNTQFIRTYGADPEEAANLASAEAAWNTQRVMEAETAVEDSEDDEEFDEGLIDVEHSMANDDTKSIMIWPGHHDEFPPEDDAVWFFDAEAPVVKPKA